MKISRAGVPGVADISNDLALPYKLTFHHAVGIALQMSVIKDELLAGAELIDGCSAAFALEEFYDLAIGSGHHRSPDGGGNINSVVHAPFCARIRERVH